MTAPVVPGREYELHWRSSRHARRLLTLSLTGIVIALIARRPEFAGVAAAALLLLFAGRARRQQPARIIVQVRLSAGRAFEGEPVTLDVQAEGQGERHVQWMLYPAAEIDPGDVIAADGRGHASRSWPNAGGHDGSAP